VPLSVNMTLEDVNQAIAGIRFYQLQKQGAVRRILDTTALAIQRGAKQRAPTRTGRLRSSIGMAQAGPDARLIGVGPAVGTNVAYAAAVEFGTRAHTIVPRARKALKFKAGQTDVFAARVHHPGTKAQPFLYPAWEEARPKFIADIARELQTTGDGGVGAAPRGVPG
jgi:HK97 gp10 family phage protein